MNAVQATFLKGDRVKYTKAAFARRRHVNPGPRIDPERIGTVLGKFILNRFFVHVLWDGRKTSESLMRSDLKRINRASNGANSGEGALK